MFDECVSHDLMYPAAVDTIGHMGARFGQFEANGGCEKRGQRARLADCWPSRARLNWLGVMPVQRLKAWLKAAASAKPRAFAASLIVRLGSLSM